MIPPEAKKVVLCGAGFLGSNIAKALVVNGTGSAASRRVQLSSRNPQALHDKLSKECPPGSLLPPVRIDITAPVSLAPAFAGADVVVSLVGTMYGSPKVFEDIQWHGAENVARAAKKVGAKLIHISAIGAEKQSTIPYARTKALGEEAVLSVCKDATILRPSLVFGPGDGFFTRFATLSKYLPFMPIFGGGKSRFQPVYVGDVARAVEIASRTDDAQVRKMTDGKIIELGGPEIFTYKEMMQLVLKHTNRSRPILSLPFAVGMVQGLVFEKLPPNLLTVTRSQVEQLSNDNIVDTTLHTNHTSFEELLREFSGSPAVSVHDVLPHYL